MTSPVTKAATTFDSVARKGLMAPGMLARRTLGYPHKHRPDKQFSVGPAPMPVA